MNSIILMFQREREDRNRITDYFSDTVPSYRFDEFYSFGRMSRHTFENLTRYIMNAGNLNQVTGLKVCVYGGGRPQLPDQIKVLLSIWYISGKD